MVWALVFSFALVVAGLVLSELLAEAVTPDAAQGTVGGLDQLASLFAALPSVLSGLLLAGTFAALCALGQAALFSAATAISHDIWDEIVDRRGPEGRRIIVARMLIAATAVGAAFLVQLWPADPAALVEWALALAAAGSFFPIVLGLWWRRCNEIGAIAGMFAGFGFTALVFLLGQGVIPDAMVDSGWANVGAPTAAMAGLLMSLAVTVGLSLVTPAPDSDARNLRSASNDRRGRLPIRERPA
jgi:cation/acetate symporter